MFSYILILILGPMMTVTDVALVPMNFLNYTPLYIVTPKQYIYIFLKKLLQFKNGLMFLVYFANL